MLKFFILILHYHLQGALQQFPDFLPGKVWIMVRTADPHLPGELGAQQRGERLCVVRLSSIQTPDPHLVLRLEHLYRPPPQSQNSPSSPADRIVGGDPLGWDREGHAGRWRRHLPLRHRINSSTSLRFWGVKGRNGVFWAMPSWAGERSCPRLA